MVATHSPFKVKILIILFTLSISVFPALCNSQYQFILDEKADDEHFHFLPDSGNVEGPAKVAFVLKTGLNLSNMNFNKGYHHPNADYIDPEWKVGYFIGAAIQIALPWRFSVSQEYLLSRRRGQYTPSESLYTLDYLSIPLLLRYSFNNSFSIVTGPQFELLISGKEDLGGQAKDITKYTEERSVGWAVGVQYSIISQFFLEARFMNGINAIGINQRNNRNEFRFELFQISGSYVFK